MVTRIDTVGAPEKLKPRREPYWQRVRKGCYVGFRKSSSKGGGWLARAREEGFRAALNLAFEEGLVTTDFAWRTKLKPIERADESRDLYLDRGQRQFLLKAPADLGAFIRGMCQVPLRPGAVAALDAGGWDRRLKVLKLGKDKSGKDRRIKLPDVAADHFDAATKDKLPTAPTFTRFDGKRWDKDAWKWPIKETVKEAGLPAGATAYTFRHSVITDLVVEGLDLLTVAQISGTSVRMIEKHYGHPPAQKRFDVFPPSSRRNILEWIANAKKAKPAKRASRPPLRWQPKTCGLTMLASPRGSQLSQPPGVSNLRHALACWRTANSLQRKWTYPSCVTPAPTLEACPRCGKSDRLRPKLLLIDAAWDPLRERDPREKYYSDLRADEVVPDKRGVDALEQFIESFFCDRCGHAFVPNAALAEGSWRAGAGR